MMRQSPDNRFARWQRRLAIAVIVLAAGFLLIQAIPYGHQRSNPAVQAEPAWDSPATRALAVRACFACHGNQTRWPWYSKIAPVSWLVQNDVEGGRSRLNFQDWNRPQRRSERIGEVVQSGGMPPSCCQWFHSEANLTAAERAQLAQGLTATISKSPPGGSAAR